MNDAAAIHARLPYQLVVLERNREVVRRLVDGVSEAQADEALRPGGSTLRWLVGHLVAHRDVLLVRAGAERIWDEAASEPYRRGTKPMPGGPALATLLDLMDAQAPALEAAFGALTPAELGAEDHSGILGDALEFLVWHDTYHIGQAALHRQAAGLESPLG